jgi:hypothetical protein
VCCAVLRLRAFSASAALENSRRSEDRPTLAAMTSVAVQTSAQKRRRVLTHMQGGRPQEAKWVRFAKTDGCSTTCNFRTSRTSFDASPGMSYGATQSGLQRFCRKRIRTEQFEFQEEVSVSKRTQLSRTAAEVVDEFSSPVSHARFDAPGPAASPRSASVGVGIGPNMIPPDPIEGAARTNRAWPGDRLVALWGLALSCLKDVLVCLLP